MATFIGIDPGENTGIAVWDSTLRQFRDVRTVPLHRALDFVRAEWQAAAGRRFLVIFEDARQRKWFKKENSVSEYRGRLMGAGAAKRDARIWEEFLTDLGCPFEMHKPQAGTTKWNADYWAKVTGWKGRSSEHSRDASLLVFDRK